MFIVIISHCLQQIEMIDSCVALKRAKVIV